MDREYTSIALSIQLKYMGYFSIGTVKKNNMDFPHSLRLLQKTTPKDMPRGDYKIAICKNHKELFACRWIDSKTVYFLSMGYFWQATINTTKADDRRENFTTLSSIDKSV
jgi:hypothetical protein